jgi:hypothetical protein
MVRQPRWTICVFCVHLLPICVRFFLALQRHKFAMLTEPIRNRSPSHGRSMLNRSGSPRSAGSRPSAPKSSPSNDTRVPLMAALQGGGNGSQTQMTAAAPKLSKAIADFRANLAAEPRIAARDDNPFGLPVAIRDTYERALDQLEDAVETMTAQRSRRRLAARRGGPRRAGMSPLPPDRTLSCAVTWCRFSLQFRS